MPKIFSLDVSKVSVEDVNNGDFLKLKMYVISDTPNRNGSEFLRDSFEKSIPTMYNKPILAYFNSKTGDTEEHNSKLNIDEFGDLFYDYNYEGAEKPVGVIPESANIYIEHVDGKNWIVIDSAYVWTEYNKRLTSLIKKQIKKRVSVEIESLDSKVNSDGIEEIGLWRFLGVTILGKTPDGEIIEEGIEGANLVLKEYANSNEFNSYKNKFSFAIKNDKSDILSKYGVIEKDKGNSMKEQFIKKEDYGTEPAISVDKSKNSVSDSSWGDVDKTSLRNTVLKAKNYKTVVKSVYLSVEEGWEDAPSEKLKYPVMQYKDGKLIYNAGGLLSAQQYGEKYDEAVAKKALSLRKKLGLAKSEKEEKMKKFIEDAKTSGFAFLGLFNGKLAFVKEEMADSEDGMNEKTEMSVFEVEKEEAEKFSCEDCTEDFAWDELTGKQVKMSEEEDDDNEEKKELSEKCAELEKEKCELSARCEAAESDLKEIKTKKFEEDTDAILSDEDNDVDEKTHEDMVKMRKEGKFATVEDFEKELAFRKYTLEKGTKKNVNKNKLDFNINTNKNPKLDKVVDALDTI